MLFYVRFIFLGNGIIRPAALNVDFVFQRHLGNPQQLLLPALFAIINQAVVHAVFLIGAVVPCHGTSFRNIGQLHLFHGDVGLRRFLHGKVCPAALQYYGNFRPKGIHGCNQCCADGGYDDRFQQPPGCAAHLRHKWHWHIGWCQLFQRCQVCLLLGGARLHQQFIQWFFHKVKPSCSSNCFSFCRARRLR